MNWLIEHRTDLVVNAVSNIPFFVFDILILTLVLPLALDWFDRIRTRALRRRAVNSLINDVLSASGRLEKEIVGPLEGKKLKPQDVDRLAAEMRACRTRLVESFPVYLQVLDAKSAEVAFESWYTHRYLYDHLEAVAVRGAILEGQDDYVDRLPIDCANQLVDLFNLAGALGFGVRDREHDLTNTHEVFCRRLILTVYRAAGVAPAGNADARLPEDASQVGMTVS